ncbi:MAG: hypothetical protein NTZ37_06940 [Methanoregula sp.]|nr:hypothetical protein [Methanoregula sp.]
MVRHPVVPAAALSVLVRSIVGFAAHSQEKIPPGYLLHQVFLFLLGSVYVHPVAHLLLKPEDFVEYAERVSIVMLHPLPYPHLSSSMHLRLNNPRNLMGRGSAGHVGL